MSLLCPGQFSRKAETPIVEEPNEQSKQSLLASRQIFEKGQSSQIPGDIELDEPVESKKRLIRQPEPPKLPDNVPPAVQY